VGYTITGSLEIVRTVYIEEKHGDRTQKASQNFRGAGDFTRKYLVTLFLNCNYSFNKGDGAEGKGLGGPSQVRYYMY
jgi:hypothetical protein